MSFFKANFTSRMYESHQMTSAVQVYEARDLDDAMRQHDRCTQIMESNYPEYECRLVTMSEIESKPKVKRLLAQTQGESNA